MVVLDKNPEQDSEWIHIKNLFEENALNSVICSEPFIKTAFLSRIIQIINSPIIYLDFDLLYSGYVQSEILPRRENIKLFRPLKEEWSKILKTILLKISKKKYCVIIDTLNGFFNIFNEKDSGRLVNGFIMLIGSIARESNSSILLTSIARKKDGEGWILSPTGRRILDSKYLKQFQIAESDSNFVLDFFNGKNTTVLKLKK